MVSGFEITTNIDAGRLLTDWSYGEKPAYKRGPQCNSLRLT